MVFRRRASPTAPTLDSATLAVRLKALGYLLDTRRYVPQGLCVIEREDGYFINGFRVPEGLSTFGLTESNEQVSGEELQATIAQIFGQ